MKIPNVQVGAKLLFGPDTDSENRKLSAGCPSACPGNQILFAGKIINAQKASYALYAVSDDWNATAGIPQLLFDDPQFEDSEPVAVYARAVQHNPGELDPPEASTKKPNFVRLADGELYSGPAGFVEDLSIRQPNRNAIPWADISTPDRLQDPRLNVVPPPPNVKSIVFYSAYRDRFDDPIKPRIKGEWKKLLVSEAVGRDGSLFTWVPYDPTMTTVLAGLDELGKVAQWSSQAKVSEGRTFFAYAGDHYSQVRVNGYHHCVGCHTGHSFYSADIRERLK